MSQCHNIVTTSLLLLISIQHELMEHVDIGHHKVEVSSISFFSCNYVVEIFTKGLSLFFFQPHVHAWDVK